MKKYIYIHIKKICGNIFSSPSYGYINKFNIEKYNIYKVFLLMHIKKYIIHIHIWKTIIFCIYFVLI